jgi:hypothetical protein
MDVGVDCHNLEPINIITIANYMVKKDWKPVDHHGELNG